MKIRDLLAILNTMDLDDEVYILDADTAWLLEPMYIGKDKEQIIKHSQGGHWNEPPKKENAIFIVSNYDEGMDRQ